MCPSANDMFLNLCVVADELVALGDDLGSEWSPVGERDVSTVVGVGSSVRTVSF